jgi:Skp family chaperone for outer membrane proteins
VGPVNLPNEFTGGIATRLAFDCVAQVPYILRMISRLPSTKGAAGMDRNMVYAGVSVVLAGLLGFSWAQGRGALNADEPKLLAGEIAVVDMAKVFDGHKILTAKREQVRREAQDAQEKFNALAQAGTKLQNELKMHKPGSAEHNRIQKELAEKAAELQKYQKETVQKLQQEEAEIYLETYRFVIEEIQRIAEARGLKLVLRYQADNLDAKDPKKLMESLNRQILYEKGLDITDDVLQAVN